ncbi:trifunctional dihydropteroate synthetase [Lobaria immixta]|nr:trifunctional dihydropteroate synthetase [Lobaria immixta]
MNPVSSIVEVEIQTTKTRTADAETADDSAWENQFPQESETAESRSAAKDSMHGVHQTLVDRLKKTQNLYTQALASQLAELAFLLSDKTFNDSSLTAVSIGISTHQIGVDGAHFAPMRLRSELNRSGYKSPRTFPARKSVSPKDHLVYVALGSNVGNRIAMLDLACRELDRSGIRVVRTSALFETEPMYLQNQPSFVNGACEVQTTLEPFDLLDKLKEIENALGRQKTVENGPRNIDLDILLYDDIHVDHERLIIPHKRILEREFVLRPLCDLIPEATLPLPLNSATFSTELFKLPKPESPLSPLTPLSPNVAPISSLSSTRTTHIMAILNLTPDSFSDGNVHPRDPNSLLPTLEEFLSAGVSIIDIGGQSTRPRAPQITTEEEILRVLPAIKFIRSQPAFDKMAISIDTYRASVADAAIAAGANIVNDISAGQMDSRMLPKIAELGCSVIMMHMRGTPETMTTLTNYPSGVLEGVGSELLKRVTEAEQAGIRRWRIMLDPGIGFAKNEAQNLELLRHFATLRQYRGLQGLPWVVGASRKRFIGRITGVQTPNLRSWGTAATVTAAIQGGADIVRVHDAVQMAQVAKMADAIWRV